MNDNNAVLCSLLKLKIIYQDFVYTRNFDNKKELDEYEQ